MEAVSSTRHTLGVLINAMLTSRLITLDLKFTPVETPIQVVIFINGRVPLLSFYKHMSESDEKVAQVLKIRKIWNDVPILLYILKDAAN